jgi:site-specific DNA-methyltransferase (cytosine-N4-specific)
MRKLLEDPDKFYKPKKRPSGHDIANRFGTDNGGAIPSNLLQIPNSESNGQYLAGCKLVGASGHPARFPSRLPEFFIQFLTDRGDLVVDIFGGSNTTGAAAEATERRWLSFEMDSGYLAASVFRFMPAESTESQLREAYSRVAAGESLDLRSYRASLDLFSAA